MSKLRNLTDCDLYKVLNWFYKNRNHWCTEGETMFSRQDLISDDLEWMVSNGLLMAKDLSKNGVFSRCYRISPGGVKERADHRLSVRLQILPIIISLSALFVSLISPYLA